jgi:hypothetical protein
MNTSSSYECRILVSTKTAKIEYEHFAGEPPCHHVYNKGRLVFSSENYYEAKNIFDKLN